MRGSLIVFTLVISVVKGVIAQSPDTLKKPNQLQPVDPPLDSLSIFQLIDSLVQMPSAFEVGSTFVARLGYNSNIVAAGRTLGLSQFGLTPGISYYHKSGLYLDATAYWSQEYSPNLYLTVPSIGYLKSTKHWTLNMEYSRYMYSFSDSTYDLPYTNAIGVTNFFEAKPFLFRLDYSLYFGEKTVHRIMPGLMLNLEKRNWKGIKRLLFYPSFYVLLGNEKWETTYMIPGFFNRVQIDKYNEFGVLNYSISFPLSLNIKNWTFLLGYTYNFQQALKNEPIDVTNSGYLSFSIAKYFNFKSKSVLTDLLKMTK